MTRSCESCGLIAEVQPTDTPGLFLVRWADGEEERLCELPPDGSICCRAHRAGSRWSHRCSEDFVHATVEEARACRGHGEGGDGVPAYGLHTKGE